MIKELKATGLALGLSGALVTGAFAAAPQQDARGGAAGLVAAVVQVVVDEINVKDNVVQVGLVNVNNALNNLTALNNVLNNSPILSNNEILKNVDITVYDVVDIQNVLNNLDLDITVADILNDLNIEDINSVIGIGVLSSGDLLVFQR